ncbi:MAG: MFS transporter [Micropruina sp.]
MSATSTHEKQTGKATASGWIGSALEYYDFFIYAQAAALIFPMIMFDKTDPRMAIIGALGTYVVGYVARPIGAFVLGSWGDKHGRKNVLVLCMLLMGVSTMLVAVLPTYQQVGILAPAMLMALRLVQGFAVAGEISGASSMILEHAPFGRRGYFGSFTLQGTQFGQILAAAVFLPLAHYLSDEAFHSWGWRVPFALSAGVVVAGYLIRRKVDETPAFTEEQEEGTVAESPIRQAFRENPGAIGRVFCMALTNIIAVTTSIFGATYATNKDYGIGFHADVYLWIPLLGNVVACVVIPLVGNLSDRIGRRPLMIASPVLCGLMSYGYLWSISQANVSLAIVFSLVMWGAVYQGYNAVFPAFYPELFPTKTRVSSMAIAQNLGTVASSAMVLVFPIVAPPGSTNVVMTVGTLTLALCVVASIAAWRSPETYRLHGDDLGVPGAQPVPEEEYLRLRAKAITEAKLAKASR